MDYTTLVANKSVPGSICNWLNRDTTDGPTILGEAQAHVYTRLRHWRMKVELEDSMVYGQSFIETPDDFIDSKDLWLTGNFHARIRRGDERSVQARYNYDVNGSRVFETPCWYYVGAPGLALDTVPD